MASSYNHHHLIHSLFFTVVFIIISTTTPASAANPKSIVLTITKDSSTSQYTTKVIQRTPPVSVPLTLDLATPYLWLDCESRYVSSTYKPVTCGSPLCALANSNKCSSCPRNPPKPGCNKNTCRTIITNPVTKKSTSPEGSELATDVIQVNSSNGATTTGLVSAPNFLFICAPKSLLTGLAKGVTGVAGFGRAKPSFPSQLSSTFKFPQIFAFCLSPVPDNGFAFVGGGSYNVTPAGTGGNVDLRSMLTYTPLITNPVRTSEYFIDVQGIKVNGENAQVNKKLLSIDSKGNGGTTISLLYSYTTMETSIYKAVTTLFDTQVKTLFPTTKRIAPIAPFEFCYNTFPGSRVGPSVQPIDLVLPSKVQWTISSLNSLVRTNSAYCLGFLDGGKNPKSSIVIGGHQIEDNLVQFDLEKSRIGFSGNLVSSRLACFNFNFTTM